MSILCTNSLDKKDDATRCVASDLLVGKKQQQCDTFLLSRLFQSNSLIAVLDFIAQSQNTDMDNLETLVFTCPRSHLRTFLLHLAFTCSFDNAIHHLREQEIQRLPLKVEALRVKKENF